MKDKTPTEKFYELYEQGRNSKAPIGYISYFEARKFWLDVIDAQKVDIVKKVQKFGEEISCEKNNRWVVKEIIKIIGGEE